VQQRIPEGDFTMSTPATRSNFNLSTDTWAILLAAVLGLIIRFGLLKSIAW
jgi:hypothetical protein